MKPRAIAGMVSQPICAAFDGLLRRFAPRSDFELYVIASVVCEAIFPALDGLLRRPEKKKRDSSQ
jgi:hypothetical protein